MATCCREKRPVLVRVYVERPTRRRLPLHNHHHHHHLYLHQPKQHINAANGRGGGYNRKAELLNYSRFLRTSARSEESSSALVSRVKQQPAPKSVAVQSKRQCAKSPSCLRNWKFLIPGFFRSLTIARTNKEKKKRKKKKNSASTRIKGVVQSFQVQKKGNLLRKLFARLQKHR